MLFGIREDDIERGITECTRCVIAQRRRQRDQPRIRRIGGLHVGSFDADLARALR